MATELLKLTIQLVTSHASISELTSAELVEEIKAVYQTLNSLETGRVEVTGAEVTAAETKETGLPKPAVPVEEAQKGDHIVCLICGQPFRTLKAHLRRAHKMNPQEYCGQFGLDYKKYPLVSKDYSEQRRRLAKEKGLGDFRKRKKVD